MTLPPDNLDDDFDLDQDHTEFVAHCDLCSTELSTPNAYEVQCASCYITGCSQCLRRGDDLFPWICNRCRRGRFR